MKLTIKRNQADVKGMFGGHKGVKFSLFGQCHVSDVEKALIAKYKVNDHVLAKYEEKKRGSETQEFLITVNDLVCGKSVTTDDISTLLDLERSMKEGCRNLIVLLAVMATFGGEQTIDILEEESKKE